MLRRLAKHGRSRALCPPAATCPLGRVPSPHSCSERRHRRSKRSGTGAGVSPWQPKNPSPHPPDPHFWENRGGRFFFQEGLDTAGNVLEEINRFVHATNVLAAFPLPSSRRERTPFQGEDIPSPCLAEITPFSAKLYAAGENTSLHIVTGIRPSTRKVPEHARCARQHRTHGSARGRSSGVLLGLGLHPEHRRPPHLQCCARASEQCNPRAARRCRAQSAATQPQGAPGPSHLRLGYRRRQRCLGWAS